ncbi:MAG: phage tail assembly protein [Clostridiales bacterium]|nr:phage tail assembly protein [Clostridiales bacterium]
MENFMVEFPFTLPTGYLDGDGVLHREGTMRRATAADEIVPLKDPRVQSNRSYLIILLLSRVITSLGDVAMITPKVIENLYIADLNYLQNFYSQINAAENPYSGAVCPHCGKPVIPIGDAPGE